MNEFIPVNEPLLNGNEKKYLMECINTGWISSEGAFVTQFEKKMAGTVNRKFGIAVTNGTVALDVAVRALELSNGAEVIMPSFTIISCAAAVVKNGCIPVLVDCDKFTWNMDASQIESKITKKTEAIMVVHIYGLPVEMNPVIDIAKKYNLKIIEDAAEMNGQCYYNQPCGSFGDVSIFSFYPNKHITTGEGGMVLTDNEKIAKRCRSIRNLCFVEEKRFIHYELGSNYRMSNIQAALGVAQLERFGEIIEKKRAIGKHYYDELKCTPGIQTPIHETTYAKNIYWVFGIVLKEDFPLDAERFLELLFENGVGARPFFWPMNEQPVFLKSGLFLGEKYPNSEMIARRGFYIPSGLTMTEEKIDKVCKVIKKIIKEYY